MGFTTTSRLEDRPGPEAWRVPPRPLAAPAFLGRHPTVVALLDTGARLARCDQPVLLLGETGTGKDLLARHIHLCSPRADGPFRALNCAAVPPGLLGAEVFGAVPGAFTGVGEGRPGILERAHGGTLFLDEVGDMPREMQAALLRVLEDGVTRRLGTCEERRLDFRLIAATNREPRGMVARGEFRADLLFRLGRTLRLPPLRERLPDVPLLVRAFLLEAAAGGCPKRLSPAAERALLAHTFPGNVRELRQILLGAAALARGDTVEREDLGLEEAPGQDHSRETSFRGPGLAEGEAAVLEAVDGLGSAGVGSIVRGTGISRRTVQRVVATLVRRGRLSRRGRGRATRYASAGPEFGSPGFRSAVE